MFSLLPLIYVVLNVCGFSCVWLYFGGCCIYMNCHGMDNLSWFDEYFLCLLELL
jgi:hypothetical protein